MSKRKDFYVFRHGATDLNKMQCWQGSGMNYDLNEDGVRQAQLLVDKLADKGLEAIFSSPLMRAKHTADILGESLHIPVMVKDDLRECFYGEMEGRKLSETAAYVDSWLNDDNPCFAGGEARNQALRRVLAVLETLTSEAYPVMGVAIHRGTMFGLLKHFKFAFTDIPNCGAFHLVYEDGDWFVEGDLF